MSQQQTQLDTWFDEVWEKGNEDAIIKLLDKDAVIHGLEIHKDYKGHDAFIPYFRKFREAFPEVHVDLEHLIKTNDQEAAFCHVTVKDTSGKSVHFDGIVIAKFKDGKIIEAWNAFDFINMYKQMGMDLANEDEIREIRSRKEGYVAMES